MLDSGFDGWPVAGPVATGGAPNSGGAVVVSLPNGGGIDSVGGPEGKPAAAPDGASVSIGEFIVIGESFPIALVLS